LGDRVIVHPGAVIGADGFGYIYRRGAHHKYPHLGIVIVEDDVEIGACACIDRAKTGVTRVQRGAKIDNLAQVAHNVVIGADSILCAQVGVAGSTRLGRLVVLGGQAGIRDNITLGDNVMVAGCSCVPQDVPSGARIAGVPAVDARQYFRQHASLARLPDLITQMRDLARRIENLEAAADHKPDRGT
jgi:UDP-3-O-[3-hydroxymyristoyl] glucosamine N-acyltransferase